MGATVTPTLTKARGLGSQPKRHLGSYPAAIGYSVRRGNLPKKD